MFSLSLNAGNSELSWPVKWNRRSEGRKERPQNDLRFTTWVEICKKKKGKKLSRNTLRVLMRWSRVCEFRGFFFRFSLTNMRKRLMPDSRLQRWRHVSALLHTISITDKGHWGHIWHNHGHFLDPAACSGRFYVQTLVHSGRTLSPSRHPTPDPSVRNKPLLLLSTANEDKGEQRLDGLSSVTLHLPSQGFFLSTYSRLHIPDKTQMTSSPLTALDSRPGSGSVLHIHTHDPHYRVRQ